MEQQYRSLAYANRFCKNIAKQLPTSQLVIPPEKLKRENTWYLAFTGPSPEAVNVYVTYLLTRKEVAHAEAQTIHYGKESELSTLAACVVLHPYEDTLGKYIELALSSAEAILLGLGLIAAILASYAAYMHNV